MKTFPDLIRRNWLEWVILIAPCLVLATLWAKFPAHVPIHWNIRGNIDGWAPKGFGLMLLPALNLFIFAVFSLAPRLDPRMRLAEGYERTVKVLRIMRIATMLFILGFTAVQIIAALGVRVAVTRLVLNGALVMLMVLGNYFSNLRPNYFAGIRTPWTLRFPGTWRATHRLGGRIMVFGALLLIALQIFVNSVMVVQLFLCFVLGFAVWSFIYSRNHAATHAPKH